MTDAADPPVRCRHPRRTIRAATIARRARTALRLPDRDKRLLVEAVAALAAARLRSAALPFHLLARRLGGLAPPGTAPCHASLSPAQQALLRDVRWAVRVAAPAMPFRAVCLQQAIAARAMLARRGIPSVMHLGVRHPVIARMEAHAWLDAGGLGVTGYPLDPAIAEVARFI